MNLKKIPLSMDFPQFKFPAYTKETTDAGHTFYKFHDPDSALVSVRIGFTGGAYYEHIPGLAGFSAKMLTNGTKNRPAVEISTATESLGASINATAQWDKAYIGATSLAKYIVPVLDIMEDCFLNAAFSDDEIERQRNIHLAAIREEQSEPQFLAKYAFNTGMYRNHPFGHPVAGTIKSISSLKRKEILQWYRDRIISGPLSVFISGNIENCGIDDKMNHILKNISSKRNIDEMIPTSHAGKTSSYIMNKAGAVQTTLRVGMKTIDVGDKNFIPLQMANVVLGGYFQSRLNQVLRQEKGYTYGVYSSIITRRAGSELSIGCDINEGATNESVRIIFDELDRMKTEIIPSDEFNKAKQYFLGSFARRLETPQQVITLLQTIDNFELEADYYDILFSKISKLTPEEVFEAQKRNFGSDNIIIGASGNVEKLENALKDYGEVNVLDIDKINNA